MESFPYRRGFTLIELLVVFAIIAVLSLVVITSQSSFNKTLVLTNTAYDLALALRSTETYGIGNRAIGSSQNANAGYGLDFQKANQTSFTLFADTYPPIGSSGLCHTPPANDPTGPNAVPGNCVYDATQGEKVMSYTIANNITISNFCAGVGSSWACANGTGFFTLSSLDIVFSRPNPVPFIRARILTFPPVSADAACITLSSPYGGSRYVAVNAAGEITVATSSCP